MNKLTYFVNNNGTMEISQNEPDGKVVVHTFHNFNDFSDTTNDIEISNDDMVMLINLYRYIKKYNIQKIILTPNEKSDKTEIKL